jgi:hypothetical protein
MDISIFLASSASDVTKWSPEVAPICTYYVHGNLVLLHLPLHVEALTVVICGPITEPPQIAVSARRTHLSSVLPTVLGRPLGSTYIHGRYLPSVVNS